MKKMTIPLIILGLAIAAGLVFFVFSQKSGGDDFDFSHTERTLQTGTPAKARILAIRDTGGRLNANPSIEFQLEVQPAGEPAFPATTRAIVSTVNLSRFQPGATVDVKYDPADHSSVALVP